MTETTQRTWLPTPAMAKALGISVSHFRKEWAHPQNGFLSSALYKAGPHHNSVKYWNREQVIAAAHEQGYVLPSDLQEEQG